jgi:kynurenine formamidase
VERQGVEIQSGDILFFRTGWRSKFKQEQNAAEFMAGEPGIGIACADWLHERDVAVIASDNWAIEVLPGEDDANVFNVHMVLIRDMGMTLGEILDLDELADDCASDGIYEFLCTAPPIKFTNAVGSPINPLAIK